MGRSNFWPGESDLNFVWYLDCDSYTDESGRYDSDMFEDRLAEAVMRIEDRFAGFWPTHDWCGEVQYMLENRLFTIGRADNMIDEAITLQVKRDLPSEYIPLAVKHFAVYKRAISQILLDMFGTVTKYGGWFCHAALSKEDV